MFISAQEDKIWGGGLPDKSRWFTKILSDLRIIFPEYGQSSILCNTGRTAVPFPSPIASYAYVYVDTVHKKRENRLSEEIVYNFDRGF